MNYELKRGYKSIKFVFTCNFARHNIIETIQSTIFYNYLASEIYLKKHQTMKRTIQISILI